VAIRDKITANAQPHLRQGEQVQAVMGAQTASQYLVLAAYIVFYLVNSYRTVVATDQRILVFDSGKLSTTKARSIVAELDRRTVLGPPKGLWHPVTLGNETVRIHKRFFKDIEQADALSGAA